jgi:hypothetical protein
VRVIAVKPMSLISDRAPDAASGNGDLNFAAGCEIGIACQQL